MATSLRRSALVATALALALSAADAWAGVKLKLVYAGRNVTLEFEGNKLRVEEQGDPHVLVFDGDDGRYLEIDTQARTWAMATRTDVVAAGKALDEEIRKGLAAADPGDVRAWVERRNWTRQRADLLKRTKFELRGGQAMLAGHMCDGFDEVVAGEVVSWGCYVTWSNKTFKRDEFAALTRLAEFLNSGFGQVQAAQGLDLRDGPLGRLSRAPGLPLFRLDLREGGRSAVPLKVEEALRVKITADRFAPPADYTALPQRAALARPARAALPVTPGLPPPPVPGTVPGAREAVPGGR